MVKEKVCTKEIVHPGMTHFATVFITLKNIFDHKHNLQTLAMDKYYISRRLSKSTMDKVVNAIVLDNKFWKDFLLMVKIVAPIIKLLHVVDTMKSLLLAMFMRGCLESVRESCLSLEVNKDLMIIIIKVIDEWWDRHLRCHIHTVAYFLNPASKHMYVNSKNNTRPS